MKAIVFAREKYSELPEHFAGCPKPLIPLLGESIISRIITLLNSHDFSNVLVLTDYSPAAWEDNQYGFVTKYIPSCWGELGLLNSCRSLVAGERDFLFMYGDCLTNIDLKDMYKNHQQSGCLVTMAQSYGMQINGDCGIYIFNHKILELLNYIGLFKTHSVSNDVLPHLRIQGIDINLYKESFDWFSLDNLSEYCQVARFALEDKFPLVIEGQKHSWGYLGTDSSISSAGFVKGKAYIGNDSQIGRVTIKGTVIIENNCTIEDNVTIENALIQNHSVIEEGSYIKDMVVAQKSQIKQKTHKTRADSNKELDNLLEWRLKLPGKRIFKKKRTGK